MLWLQMLPEHSALQKCAHVGTLPAFMLLMLISPIDIVLE